MPAPFGVRSGAHPGDDLGTWDGSGTITIPGDLRVGGSVVAVGPVAGGSGTTMPDLTVTGNLTDNGTLFTNVVQVFGGLSTQIAGARIQVKEGAGAVMGTATLVGGSATVANTSVTAVSRIFLTSQVDGGGVGFLRVSTRTAGVSFVITSSSGTDTSTVAWIFIDPS